jgi:hypothetical protein
LRFRQETADDFGWAGSVGGGGGSAQVVSAVSERDRSVLRILPLANETSLHKKPLSSLASSTGQLFTGATGRPTAVSQSVEVAKSRQGQLSHVSVEVTKCFNECGWLGCVLAVLLVGTARSSFLQKY